MLSGFVSSAAGFASTYDLERRDQWIDTLFKELKGHDLPECLTFSDYQAYAARVAPEAPDADVITVWQEMEPDQIRTTPKNGCIDYAEILTMVGGNVEDAQT